MALVPGRQFCPSTFHGTRVNFFGYGSSISKRNHFLCSSEINLSSTSFSEQNPLSKSRSFATFGGSSNNSNWLDRWNDKKNRTRPKEPQIAMNYRNKNSRNPQGLGFDERGSAGGGGGGGGGTTMERIVEKLKKFGYMDTDDRSERRQERPSERAIEKGSVEDIFYVEEGMLPDTRGGFSEKSPFGDNNVFGSDGEVKFPWEKKTVEEEEGAKWTARSKSKTSVAELTLPESELRRLRILTFQAKNKMRIGGAGVTQAIVDKIHERWKTLEIVRLKIEGAPALNMKRMHEILERKTGGLVVWRSGTSVSLYRGISYEAASLKLNKRVVKNETGVAVSSTAAPSKISVEDSLPYSSSEQAQIGVEATDEDNTKLESSQELEYEDEMDKFLDSLGPRYKDWPGSEPLPVDADMLQGIVPGYQPPFRVLPYGVRATLFQKEATALRRLARVLPPHFALGRSRQLQGLAKAMIKLWERSSIAKVALKRGVQLTTSERMAEDIKKLTGGLLLSRNKDFLVFYRGKDFLSPDVTEALLERERLAKSFQDEEEQARLRAAALVMPSIETNEQLGTAGTLGETLDAKAKWKKNLDDTEKMRKEAEMARHMELIRKLDSKLSLAERKLVRAERALGKVESSLQPTERQADPDSITDEERFMFRKLGLRMKAFLLLGRRGVFDGTVENMHLHWKYRELVKIMVNAKSFDQVKKIALALEAESGGVLVSVDKVSKGYAVIVYRGKDYKRPSTLRPKNLLTKRKALARSIELQRHEAFLKHVSALQNKVEKLRSEIGKMHLVKDQGDVALYDKLDSAYPTDDDDSEEEGDEAYLETYESENDGEDESSGSTYYFLKEANLPNDEGSDLSEEESEELIPHAYTCDDVQDVDL